MMMGDVTMYPGRVFLILLLPHHHKDTNERKGKTKERQREDKGKGGTNFLRSGHKVSSYDTLYPIDVFLRKAITAAVAFSSWNILRTGQWSLPFSLQSLRSLE